MNDYEKKINDILTEAGERQINLASEAGRKYLLIQLSTIVKEEIAYAVCTFASRQNLHEDMA